MSVILVFLLVVIGVAGWWLSQQRLMTKPWLEKGAGIDWEGAGATGLPTAKIGLGIFLAVVGALFALFASAYFMRMEFVDWQTPPLPRVIWLSTALLIASSIALHISVVSVRNGEIESTRLALVTGGLTALAFLGGQLLAWRELSAGGYLLETNAANGFFYLMTGMHGLHIIGGLFGLAVTTRKAWSTPKDDQLRLNVELCAMYWHFLLFIWVAVLFLLAGWASDFIDICRQLLN